MTIMQGMQSKSKDLPLSPDNLQTLQWPPVQDRW